MASSSLVSKSSSSFSRTDGSKNFTIGELHFFSKEEALLLYLIQASPFAPNSCANLVKSSSSFLEKEEGALIPLITPPPSKALLKTLKEVFSKREENFDLLALLEPTSPLRRKGDIDRFIEVAGSIFSGIAYSVGSELNEANFHTLFYLMVNAGGTPADIELLTSDGRIDMVVKLKDKIYIMEFKCNQSADKAIEQIKEKDYISRFKFQGVELYILGINFDTEKRNISEYKYEIIKS